MEEVKESEPPIANNKGSSNELNYDLEYIVQLNDLAKTVVGSIPKVVPIFQFGFPSTGTKYQNFKMSLVYLVQALSQNLLEKSIFDRSLEQKLTSLDLQQKGRKTRNQTKHSNLIDDQYLRSIMLQMIQQADELQRQVNDQKIAESFGKISHYIEKCLRNSLSEQKSDHQELELINTSSSNLEQLNLVQHNSPLNKKTGNEKPKFQAGKIVNKYLLVEILSFSFYQEEIMEKMYSTSHSFRLLLIENLKAIKKMTHKAPTIEISFKQYTYYFRPVSDRIIRFNFTCEKMQKVKGILQFFEEIKYSQRFQIKDHSITYIDLDTNTNRDYLREVIDQAPDFVEFPLIKYNLKAHAFKILMRDPVKYEMDPKVIINQLDVNFDWIRYNMVLFAFDVTEPMKSKIKVRHLNLSVFLDFHCQYMRHLLNLYIQPIDSLTIELTDQILNRDTFFGILQDFFDAADLEQRPKVLEIQLQDAIPDKLFFQAFDNLKLRGCEKKLKVFHCDRFQELKDAPDSLLSSLEVKQICSRWANNYKFKDEKSLRLYLTAKGKIKSLNFQDIMMVIRESLYYKSLRTMPKFIDLETEELTLSQFNPSLHSLFLGQILSCCHSLNYLQIKFQDPLPNAPVEKFEEFDQGLRDVRKLTFLSIHDTNCNYQHFTKYLMDGLKHKLTSFKISYSNPEPYLHSQYLKDELVSCLNVTAITKVHVQDFEQIQDTIHLFASLKELIIEDLNTKDVPIVMELVGQEVAKEGNVDPMEPKKRVGKKKKRKGEEEVQEPEYVPIEYQVLRPVRMPQIEKLTIDVVSIQKEIYLLEFPHLKELRVKILEAPKFQDCVIALSKNMIRKGSLLRVEAQEDKIGIKPSGFKKILRDHPQANIEIQVLNDANNDMVLELLQL